MERCYKCGNKGFYKCGYEGLFIEDCNCKIGGRLQNILKLADTLEIIQKIYQEFAEKRELAFV